VCVCVCVGRLSYTEKEKQQQQQCNDIFLPLKSTIMCCAADGENEKQGGGVASCPPPLPPPGSLCCGSRVRSKKHHDPPEQRAVTAACGRRAFQVKSGCVLTLQRHEDTPLSEPHVNEEQARPSPPRRSPRAGGETGLVRHAHRVAHVSFASRNLHKVFGHTCHSSTGRVPFPLWRARRGGLRGASCCGFGVWGSDVWWPRRPHEAQHTICESPSSTTSTSSTSSTLTCQCLSPR